MLKSLIVIVGVLFSFSAFGNSLVVTPNGNGTLSVEQIVTHQMRMAHKLDQLDQLEIIENEENEVDEEDEGIVIPAPPPCPLVATINEDGTVTITHGNCPQQ